LSTDAIKVPSTEWLEEQLVSPPMVGSNANTCKVADARCWVLDAEHPAYTLGGW